MTERLRVGAALLAAGSSRRFGGTDKLAALFRGRRLGEHASKAIPTDLLDKAWVIASSDKHSCEPVWRARRFDPVINPDARKGMGTSVALAATLAQRDSLDALLIALADMPLVPREHFEALIAAVSKPSDIAVSSTGSVRMPPALFGSDHLGALAASSDDSGARDLLGSGRVIACPPQWLADIDTPETLAALN